MKTLNENTVSDDRRLKFFDFKRLPSFAAFLLEQRFDEFIHELLRVSREVDLPLLQHFKHFDDNALVELSKPPQAEVLSFLAENRANELIELGSERWITNQIKNIDNQQIAAEDITLGSYVRKAAMLKFVPEFTSDVPALLELLNEIDAFSHANDTAALTVYQKVLFARIRETEAFNKQAHALAKIGTWWFDLEKNEVHWSDELREIYGVDADLKIDFETALGFTHPDDTTRAVAALQEGLNSKKSYAVQYRVVTPQGEIKMLMNRANVITDTKGNVKRVVGSIQDISEHQHLIEQLEESQTLYKQAQTLAKIGSWTWDLNNRTMVWSEELFRIHGLEPTHEPVSVEKAATYGHPDDLLRMRDAIVALFKSDQPVSETYFRIRLQDGTEKMLWGKAEVLRDENGWVTNMRGTAQDVTEQYLLETQLRDNQNFIQKIADATPSIIASYNINTGKYLFVSGGLEKLLGYDPRAALQEGLPFFAGIIHPDDLNPTMEKNAAAVERANETRGNGDDNLLTEFVYRLRHRDGHYRWFRTYATVFSRDENGLVENELSISLDITEQTNAVRQLEERERFIHHIADASPTVLFLYDLHSRAVLYANDEIRFALGYSPSEILSLGNLFTPTLFHPEDILKSPDHNYTEAGKELLVQYECRMKHANGTWRWMLMREVIYQRDATGMPSLILSAALDITERKLMERSLTQKTTELQQTNANLAEFAYVASHDLKEPLRKIQVFADRIIAKEEQRLTETGKDWFRRMQVAASRMDTMIDDLLSFSRTNTNETPAEPTDLNKLLELVKTDLSVQIERSKAKIEAKKLPTLNVVPIQFRQLMQNFVSNALKFHKPDEPPLIKIDSDTVPGNETHSPFADKGKLYVKISFSDNGIGFEQEYADRIFGLFQRLHGKGEYPGTGIGLALCKKVAENHGGFIVADGKPGIGATFNVFLPAS